VSKYVNGKELGRGGFGVVYECAGEEDGQAFAKKVLGDDTPEVMRRFRADLCSSRISDLIFA